VGPTADLDDVEKRKLLNLPGLELRPLCRPARKPVAVQTALSRLICNCSQWNTNFGKVVCFSSPSKNMKLWKYEHMKICLVHQMIGRWEHSFHSVSIKMRRWKTCSTRVSGACNILCNLNSMVCYWFLPSAYSMCKTLQRWDRLTFCEFSKSTKKTKLNSVAWVREQTIPTERPNLVGEVSGNFCG
jgi:hypothetical protein